MSARSGFIAGLVAVVALSGVASASAATPSDSTAGAAHKHVTKSSSVRRATGTTGVRPIKVGGSTAVAISAFPTGGKGSGTEATCGLWSDRLNADQDAEDNATEKDEIIDAHDQLNADKDNALDAGCVVID